MTDELNTRAIQDEFYIAAKTQLDIITMTTERIRSEVSTMREWAMLVDLLADQMTVLRNIVSKRILLNHISDVTLRPEYMPKKREGE